MELHGLLILLITKNEDRISDEQLYLVFLLYVSDVLFLPTDVDAVDGYSEYVLRVNNHYIICIKINLTFILLKF